MYQCARHFQLPERETLLLQAVQAGAVGLMHAVAENNSSARQGRRADNRKLQVRRALAPGDALSRPWIGGKAVKGADVKGAEAGDEHVIVLRHGSGDEMLLALECPQDFWRRRASDIVRIGRALQVAAVSRPWLPGVKARHREAKKAEHHASFDDSHHEPACLIPSCAFDHRSPLLAGLPPR